VLKWSTAVRAGEEKTRRSQKDDPRAPKDPQRTHPGSQNDPQRLPKWSPRLEKLLQKDPLGFKNDAYRAAARTKTPQTNQPTNKTNKTGKLTSRQTSKRTNQPNKQTHKQKTHRKVPPMCCRLLRSLALPIARLVQGRGWWDAPWRIRRPCLQGEACWIPWPSSC
jgi:hypothetical protein